MTVCKEIVSDTLAELTRSKRSEQSHPAPCNAFEFRPAPAWRRNATSGAGPRAQMSACRRAGWRQTVTCKTEVPTKRQPPNCDVFINMGRFPVETELRTVIFARRGAGQGGAALVIRCRTNRRRWLCCEKSRPGEARKC